MKEHDVHLRANLNTRKVLNKRLEKINEDLKRSGVKTKLTQKEFLDYLAKQPLILSTSELRKLPKKYRRVA